MSKIGILFLNAYESNCKEKIDCTFKITRFEEFLVVAEVASFVGNPEYDSRFPTCLQVAPIDMKATCIM